MSTTRACPQCGKSLPPGSPQGLCPRCLTEVESSTTGTQKPAGEPARRETPRVDYAEFQRAAVETGLVDAEALEPFAAAALGDVSRLARALVRAGKLTTYQAAALSQGKAAGLVLGDYLVLEKLGQGGMGVVFKARHRTNGAVVALKILPPSFGRDRDVVLRFRREFEVAARLSHPNVVTALDAAEHRGVHFLTMEYVDGHDLADLVGTVGPLPVKLAVNCMIQAATGMAAAHAQGVVHRDIKPANLTLDASGAVRVLDLGLARVVAESNPFGHAAAGTLTQSGAYLGTVDFMAPEQADDPKNVDHRADIYSLGCTLYFLLTGRPPFEEQTMLKRLMAHQSRPAPSLYAARGDIPQALEAAYQAMVAKRPGDRPQSMTEVVAILEACRSSAEEPADARAGLKKAFAETVMKRASPRGRRGLDASVFARPTPPGGLYFDPDLRLEDLVMDFRPEDHPGPLPEHKLPPLPPRRPRAPRGSRRRTAANGAGVMVAALLLAVVGYALFHGMRPRPAAPEAARLVAARQTVPAAEAKFQPLFRGNDLSGWAATASTLDDWHLEDGVLSATGNGNVETKLLSRRSYADFVVRFDFQLEQGTNSGFLLIGPEGGKYPSLEVELGGKNVWRNTGGLWYGERDRGATFRHPDPPPKLKPGDPWDTLEVEFRGRRLTLTLNGHPLSYFLNLADLAGPRQIGFQAMAKTVRFRNVEILDLSAQPSPARPPRTFYADDFDVDWRSTFGSSTQGNEKGTYYFDTAGTGVWWWDCPGYGLPAFTLNASGRVVGEGDGDQGSWGVQVPIAADRAFQVWINSKGELWYETDAPVARGSSDSTTRFGPFACPTLTSAELFNTLTLHMRPGQVEVLVNARRVCGPLKVEWSHDIGKVMKYIGCQSGRVRVEFDRMEIKESVSPSTLLAASRTESLSTTPTAPSRPRESTAMRLGRVLYADNFDNPASGWMQRTTSVGKGNRPFRQGYENGAYFLEAPERWQGTWASADCMRPVQGPFQFEGVGRVLGVGPLAAGAWGLMVVGPDDRGFQVMIDRRGWLFVDPAFYGWERFPADPHFGPITHKAIQLGEHWNTLTLRVEKHRLGVHVNGQAIGEPVTFTWDLTPARCRFYPFKPDLDTRIRAELDRIEIRELAP